MTNYLKKVSGLIWKNKGLLLAITFALLLFVPSIWGIQKSQRNEVLAATTQKVEQVTPTLTPTNSPTPTPLLKIIPTHVLNPTLTPVPTSTPTNTGTSNSTSSNSTSTTPTAVPSATPTPSPTPVGLTVYVNIDYAGAKSPDSYTVSIQPGQSAWDAVVAVVGESNLQYTDYGGDFGKFITGFNGISADPNTQFYQFNVNGAESNVGVSGYHCQDGDTLSFTLTTF